MHQIADLLYACGQCFCHEVGDNGFSTLRNLVGVVDDAQRKAALRRVRVTGGMRYARIVRCHRGKHGGFRACVSIPFKLFGWFEFCCCIHWRNDEYGGEERGY